MFYYVSLLALCIQTSVNGVSIEFNGKIDLGPNWNYEYNLSHQPSDKIYKRGDSAEEANAQVPKKTDETSQHHSKVYDNPHDAKDDKKINEFAFHVYKQSLKVFDAIKQKLDPSLAHKVDFITRSYDEKFRSFVDETLNQKIKTRLGTQKVVLNTIDTSNRLLKRLVNYFIGEVSQDGVLRKENKMALANVLLNEVDKELLLEHKHACSKFAICTTTNGFNSFLADVLAVLIKSDKVKQGSDALTEVLKATDFTKIMETTTEKKWRYKIADVEFWDEAMTRSVFTIFRNIVAMKNHPIKVMVQDTGHINNTLAFLEILEEFDKALMPNEENNLEWSDLKSSLNDWSSGKREDVWDIMQSLVGHVMTRGVDKMEAKKRDGLKQKFSLLIG